MVRDNKILQLESEIKQLSRLLDEKTKELHKLIQSEFYQDNFINNYSSPMEKVKLFRSLFKGREDVYAIRFESKKTGKSGYQPACQNEWRKGLCNKPKVKCINCPNRDFQPITDNEITFHLKGEIDSGKDFVMGIYPLLPDESCHFLAIDFDKENWQDDVKSFIKTCTDEKIPASIERSRSGNGGHIWIFFRESVKASLARKLGSILMTKTLDKRPEIGLESFDRFFPNQDTMPKGGFGNLIALPLQKKARNRGNSVFLDSNLEPIPDQWTFLSEIKKIEPKQIESYVQRAQETGEILPLSYNENESDTPWAGASPYPEISDDLPQKVEIVMSNQIFISSRDLPPQLRNRILRLASFSNPEFYQAQAMRLPTWNKPRLLYLYEQFPNHIALPIGCLDDLKDLMEHYHIHIDIKDERQHGNPVDVSFYGELRKEQKKAAKELLKNELGVLSATTAFGKTVIGIWLIAQRQVNTLILVHRKQLMEQWVIRLSQFLNKDPKEIGVYGGGKKRRNGKMDVAVIQSVTSKGETQEWIKEYGQVIVDECHHISAYSFEQTIRKCPAYYKVGLSATIRRKDGQHPIIFMNLGPIRYSVNAKKQAQKRSFEHIIKIRQTDMILKDFDKLSIQETFKSVIENRSRNKLIADDILELSQKNRHILVISERTGHLSVLFDLLEEKGLQPYLLKGGLGKKKTSQIMKDIENADKKDSIVILATGKYLGEGIDLPFLDTLLLTFPVSWKGTLAQYAGRLHRDYDNKKDVIIYDYADIHIPVLDRMHQKRLKGYKALGYQIYPGKA